MFVTLSVQIYSSVFSIELSKYICQQQISPSVHYCKSGLFLMSDMDMISSFVSMLLEVQKEKKGKEVVRFARNFTVD
jgi:hypothetical protein